MVDERRFLFFSYRCKYAVARLIFDKHPFFEPRQQDLVPNQEIIYRDKHLWSPSGHVNHLIRSGGEGREKL